MGVTVAIPCLNEATTIAKVVNDYRSQLPDADIVVFDNASTDGTAEKAREAGAAVIREKRRGKGYVMQSIFEKIDSDICIIVDGDDTYFAEDVHTLLAPVAGDEADLVVGNRLRDTSLTALTDLRRFGNHVIVWIANLVFRTSFKDLLSGFRVVNRNFMRTVPLITGGFETETELTLQALEKGMVIQEVPIRYRERPKGSHSKLSPFADGYRIVITIAMLLRNHRPLYFFALIALFLMVIDLIYAILWLMGPLSSFPGWFHFLVTIGLMLMAGGLVLMGVVMNAINAGFREIAALQRRSR